MDYGMKGKVAFVTGASSGIGRATALAFAREGCNVAIVDRNPAGEETAAEARKMGVKAFFQRCDISSASEVEKAVARTVQEFGSLDYAFNNAGIDGEQAPTNECTIENWDKVVAVDLKGVWLCMKYQIPHMTRQGAGAIVNCASIAGLLGFPNIPAYTASKHGVIGLTKSAALELASKEIRVNAVCPGVIETPMVEHYSRSNPETAKALVANEPVGRMGRPEEIADAVLWLSSNRSTFVTGVALPVDGGWTAK